MHPNKGFSLSLPSTSRFATENYPSAAQTQVVAVTGNGNTAGFWVDSRARTTASSSGTACYNGRRTARGRAVKTTQILGINNAGVAVGFYNDAQGNPHAFKYNQQTRHFTALAPPNADSAVATGYQRQRRDHRLPHPGQDDRGLPRHPRPLQRVRRPWLDQHPGLRRQRHGEVVGSYLDAAGMTHGFLSQTRPSMPSFKTIDDPLGIGNTIINGVNDKSQLVGFYTNTAKNTIGFLAIP